MPYNTPDPLPTDIDLSYANDNEDPSVLEHQLHHDELHRRANIIANWEDQATWPDGAIGFYNASLEQVVMTDPEIEGSPGPQGPPGADGASFTWLGGWDGATAYVTNDVVSWEGSAYIALSNNTGSEPPSANWDLLAAAGSDGLPGSQGQQGPAGAQGEPGPTESLLEVQDDLGAAFEFDFAQYDYIIGELSDDCAVTFADSAGSDVSAFTALIFMGSGGPHDLDWSASGVIWMSGTAPDFSGVTTGQFKVLVFNKVTHPTLGVLVLGFEPGVGGGGGGSEPPPAIYPELDVEVLTLSPTSSTDQATPYVGTTPIQIGAERVGHLFVLTTMANTDPPLNDVTGAGASSWTPGATTPVGTGGTRRRLEHFVAQDPSSGAASPITITQQGAGGNLLTGCIAILVRTPRAPSTAKALAASRSRAAQGGNTAPTVALDPPADAANRALACIVDNGSAAVFTPESGFAVISGGQSNITNPSVRMRVMWNDTAFDQSPSGSFTAAVNWGIVATELEQGPMV